VGRLARDGQHGDQGQAVATRAFVRSLHLLSGHHAWRLWCRTHAGDVPTRPHRAYAGNGWISWPDFLGNQPDENEECGILPRALPEGHPARFAKLRGCGHRYHRPCIAEWREAGDGTLPSVSG
jgi:hypothetical protein